MYKNDTKKVAKSLGEITFDIAKLEIDNLMGSYRERSIIAIAMLENFLIPRLFCILGAPIIFLL